MKKLTLFVVLDMRGANRPPRQPLSGIFDVVPRGGSSSRCGCQRSRVIGLRGGCVLAACTSGGAHTGAAPAGAAGSAVHDLVCKSVSLMPTISMRVTQTVATAQCFDTRTRQA